MDRLIEQLEELCSLPYNSWKSDPDSYYRKIEAIGTKLFDSGGVELLKRVRQERFSGHHNAPVLDSVWGRINRVCTRELGPPQETEKQCTHCSAKGKVDCPVCRGLGRVKGVLGLFTHTCTECNGGGSKRCSRCGGTGTIIEKSIRHCPKCKKELSIYSEDLHDGDYLRAPYWVLSCAPCGYRERLPRAALGREPQGS